MSKLIFIDRVSKSEMQLSVKQVSWPLLAAYSNDVTVFDNVR